MRDWYSILDLGVAGGIMWHLKHERCYWIFLCTYTHCNFVDFIHVQIGGSKKHILFEQIVNNKREIDRIINSMVGIFWLFHYNN